jgi:hypothetical protein
MAGEHSSWPAAVQLMFVAAIDLRAATTNPPQPATCCVQDVCKFPMHCAAHKHICCGRDNISIIFTFKKEISFDNLRVVLSRSSAEAGQSQYVELLQQLLAAQGATLEVRGCIIKRV